MTGSLVHGVIAALFAVGLWPHWDLVWCVNNPQGDRILLVAPKLVPGADYDGLAPLFSYVPDDWPWWIPMPTKEAFGLPPWWDWKRPLNVRAPVPKGAEPPKPKRLTCEDLVGYWSYSWATCPDGLIWFFPDGTYLAVHDRNATTAYCGMWGVDGGTVTLDETGFDAATGRAWKGGTYRFEFEVADYPTLKGTSNGGGRVVFSNRQR